MTSQQILVVDDEMAMRQLVRLYLQTEFSVLEAADGSDALTKLKEHDPALVLLDVMMPTLDGWETLRQIREESAVPVVMLTALGEPSERMQGLQMGADDYISKPFDGRELIARVQAVLRRSNRTDMEVDRIDVGDLVIRPDHHIAEWSGKPLDLTPKEFDLLLLLAKHVGQVVSRERLLYRVWGSDYTGSIRTVDSHIKNLREKLGDDGTLIATVWGLGYRLMEIGRERRH